MADTPTTEPTIIEAGSTLEWRREDLTADYPASEGWILSYALVTTSSQIEITASADGDFFAVSETAATTAAYIVGDYKWKAYATKATERFNVDAGSIEIVTNFATQSSGFDARSDAQTIYEACEALILSKATNDQKSYQLEGRSLERYGPGEIAKLRDYYKSVWDSEIEAEKLANGKKTGVKVKTFFVQS